MSFDLTRIVTERKSAVTAQVEALFSRGNTRLGDRYSEAELQLAVVSFLFEDVRAGRPLEVPPSLRELFAVFAYAAGARPDTSPVQTQALLAAFLARHPARPDLLRELQALAVELEHEEREALADKAMAASDARPAAKQTFVGPKISASPLAAREAHAVVDAPFR